MKYKYLLIIACCIGIIKTSFSQIIWSEDFEGYVINSGYKGSISVPSGDYPSSVSKWTLDVTNSTLLNSNCWFMVNQISSNKLFETRNVIGEAIWQSEVIPISNYVDVSIEVSISEVGTHESNDYIKLYYKLDNGSEVLFSVNGENYDDFGSKTAMQLGLSGDSIRIVIKTLNTSVSEKIRFDDVKVKGVLGTASLLFTEIVDPSDDIMARYIELKNVSNESIDFDQLVYYVSRQNDGNSDEWYEVQLSGILPKNGIRLIGKNAASFNTAYGISSIYNYSGIDGDGRDTYVLYSGGNHTRGVVVDVFGKINEDGDGKQWAYSNKRAIRNSNVSTGVNQWSNSEWTISSATVNDASPGALENEYRFNGGMWSPNNSAPTSLSSSKSVVIQSGTATITSNFDCASLNVLNGSTLALNAGLGITVNGQLSCNGTLKLKSDSLSNSSLIVTGESVGNIQYDLYLSGGAANPWHLISAPVSTQSINAFVTSEGNSLQTSVSNNYALAAYNSSTAQWNYFHNGLGESPNIAASSSGNFQLSKGYSILRSSSGEVSFSGNMATTNQVVSIVAQKWNLIGNPFPNFVNANAAANVTNNFLTVNTEALDDGFEAIYLWNPISESYDIINGASGASFISPCQGFYVYADSDGGDVLFTENMQSHQSGDWFERSAIDETSMELSVDFGDEMSAAEIKFINGATSGMDVGYDAGRFTGDDKLNYVYTQIIDGSQDSIELALQCLPVIESNPMSIPVGVNVSADKEVMFKLSSNTFDDGVSVYIEDLLLETFTRLDLENSYYSVLVDAGQLSIGRFYLHIQIDESGIIDLINNDYIIFLSENASVLNVIGIIPKSSIVSLYDSFGSLVLRSRADSREKLKIKLPQLSPGLYVMKLETGQRHFSKKIIIP